MGFHICITNQDAVNISISQGIYGNVGNSKESRNVIWGKIRDLYAVKPGDLIVLYVKNPCSHIVGVFEVTSNPYVCIDGTFGKGEKYPYRFNFKEKYHFPNPIPVFEFYNLIEIGKINSMATLEKDMNSSYRGIMQLFENEYKELLDLFHKYNPKTDYLKVSPNVNKVQKRTNIEAIDFNPDKISSYKQPTEVLFNKIPLDGKKAILENVIHTYVAYNLIHDLNDVRSALDLNNFSEIILEAPVFKTMQFRSDILTTFKNDNTTTFYSFIELKKEKNIKIEDFSQLIGYLKSFALSRKLPANSFEGIYISYSFDADLIDYLQKRKTFEKENIICLIQYSVDSKGLVTLTKVL